MKKIEEFKKTADNSGGEESLIRKKIQELAWYYEFEFIFVTLIPSGQKASLSKFES